ncbi:hypothetical protein BJY52DRAFT_1421208 [Lactarius psammicola]|nr:hypothetical protein BJY52DRAFT_1421208 [Lactarius psammicola]
MSHTRILFSSLTPQFSIPGVTTVPLLAAPRCTTISPCEWAPLPHGGPENLKSAKVPPVARAFLEGRQLSPRLSNLICASIPSASQRITASCLSGIITPLTSLAADVLASTQSLHAELTRDPPHAYYGAVAAGAYLHTVRRNHAPHVRAHIREYFTRGAHRFGIFGLVEALPLLLLASVHLFFAGLVAFAFRANHTVAYFTVAVVGFCTLSYIALTLMLLWYSAQINPLFFFSVLYRGAKQSHDRWGTVSESMVKSFRDRHKNKAKSLSEGMMPKLENSAKRISMDIYKTTLVRTLHWLNEVRELEEFVAGIPGLCESEALATRDNNDTQRTIRDVLAVLPRPTSFHTSLPWSIVQLAQRAFTSTLPKSVQQRRTRACLKALYYIPGAIRDVLAPCGTTPNDDIALSVRCAAAVVAAFMITPPCRTLDNFITPNICFIWDDNHGKQFLAKRLRVGADADGGIAPEYHPRSDSARLRNIQGDWRSPTFMPAAQQDLITLTLEILAQDPVADAATSQCEAFRDACMQLTQVASTQARAQALAQTQILSELVLETLARTQVQVVDSIEVVKRALEPVAQSLWPQIDDKPTLYDDPPPAEILELRVVSATAATVCPDDGPVPTYAGSVQGSSPPPTEAVLLQYSASSSSAGRVPATGELGHWNWADALPRGRAHTRHVGGQRWWLWWWRDGSAVHGVHGVWLAAKDCGGALRALMRSFVEIGAEAEHSEEVLTGRGYILKFSMGHDVNGTEAESGKPRSRATNWCTLVPAICGIEPYPSLIRANPGVNNLPSIQYKCPRVRHQKI